MSDCMSEDQSIDLGNGSVSHEMRSASDSNDEGDSIIDDTAMDDVAGLGLGDPQYF